jgi:Flp pilus assembly pilin Flp
MSQILEGSMSKTLEKLYAMFRRLARRECGQDLIEYGLGVSLIALACISGMQGAAGSVSQAYGQVAQALVPDQQAPPPSHHHHGGGDGGGGGGWWHHH